MLRCVSPYKSSLGAFQPGDVITDAELCAALLNDSPLSFEAEGNAAQPEIVTAAIEAPEVDKQVKRGKTK